MKTFLVIMVILLAVYVVGALVMFAYLRGGNVKMALLWPLTLIWMFFGNIG